MRVKTKVTGVQTEGAGWVVTTETAERFSGRALLLTPPVPQSLQLLAACNVASRAVRGDLEQIEYAPCLALLAELPGASLIPEPGGLWFDGEPISWMADNRCKGVSPGAGAAITSTPVRNSAGALGDARGRGDGGAARYSRAVAG